MRTRSTLTGLGRKIALLAALPPQAMHTTTRCVVGKDNVLTTTMRLHFAGGVTQTFTGHVLSLKDGTVLGVWPGKTSK